MKIKLCVLIFILTATLARAQTNDLTSLLQQGLLEEQANRNLDAAIADYQTLALQFDKNRQIAATAIFRLGECYRMQGQTNQAAAQYQRILSDFSDQPTLATMSRQNLTGMGMAVPTADATQSAAARQIQHDFLADEIKLTEQQLASQQAQVKLGVSPPDAVFATQQQLLELKRQLAVLAAGQSISTPAVATTDAEDQEIQRIQTMIQNSPDLINAAGGDGITPLARAAANGWLKVAAYLLDHGADVDNRNGTVPLLAAVTAGNKAMTQFLLDHGADVNVKSNEGKTPLAISAERSFPAVMEVLLANKADINALENWGRTPLMWAAWQKRNGSEKIMAMLLEHKPDVNTQDQSGATALMNAAVVGSLENVKVLLAAGTDPNLINSDGRTALSYAAEKNSPELVKMLLDAKADPNIGTLDLPLLVAIHQKDAASAELLLEAGASQNVKGKVDWVVTINGESYDGAFKKSVAPLYLATSTKQFPLVQLLLKYKADPNDSQIDGRPVLLHALNDTNILEALLDAGAKVDARESTSLIVINGVGKHRNWTPLLFAVANDFPADLVGILLKHGANPNAQDSVSGQTPLHLVASRNGDAGLSSQRILNLQADLNLLLDYKAELNTRDDNGQTPLDIFKQQLASDSLTPERKISIAQFADLLRQHGALDKLPDWDRIIVSRPSAHFSQKVFQKGTNDWNRFTLLETILNFYSGSGTPVVPNISGSEMPGFPIPVVSGSLNFLFSPSQTSLPFPDLAHIIIVRPSHDSTNETRIEVNLLNSTNGIDCAKDVSLQFGDVVEIPEYTHALADAPVGLNGDRTVAINNFLTSKAELTSQGQKAELSFHAFNGESFIGAVLNQPEAQKILQSSSDFSRVKVTRRDSQTCQTQAWIVDCSDSKNPPDLRVRNGDVIDVPEK